jgi:nitrite reductase (NADH) small subunit
MVEDTAERTTVCRFDELEDGSATLVTVRGRKIALCRVGQEVFAMQDACPHRGGPLSFGKVSGKRLELICPWHFFRYDLRTGASVTNPEMINETYPVTVENGDVVIEMRNKHAR